jgi:hypothetical protein
MTMLTRLIGGTLSMALLCAPATAAPLMSGAPPTFAKSHAADLMPVRSRSRGGRRHSGPGVLPWLGAGIIAGAIIANQRREPRYYEYYEPYYDDGIDAYELCARRFRSFEWDTGLYTTYAGYKRLCPYLR